MRTGPRPRRIRSAVVAIALAFGVAGAMPTPAGAAGTAPAVDRAAMERGTRPATHPRTAARASLAARGRIRPVRDGTLARLHDRHRPRSYRLASFGCEGRTAALPHALSTPHFLIRYGAVRGGLGAASYGAALEDAYQTEVTSFGWARPPTRKDRHLAGQRYPIRIEPQSGSEAGVTSNEGAYAGKVGDNPATPWTETDAQASCMSLSNDFGSFASRHPRLLLRATAAHEFVHMIQYGLGTLTGDEHPDDSFIEGTAAWMEDEVVDAADENYEYLCPGLTQSMGDYPPAGNLPYGYWLVFRGLTERFGTGTAGGGEDVMQVAWESMSRGKGELAAMAAGVASRGLKLGPAFHDVAVAYRFAKTCGGGYAYPFCFEEADRYRSLVSPPPAARGSVDLATPFTGNVRDDYAARWIALPEDVDELKVTVTSQGEGKLRASVDCNTGSGIEDTPFADVVLPGTSKQVKADLSSCTGKAYVVVTNEHVTSSDPSDSPAEPFQVKVETPLDLDGTFQWLLTTDTETSDVDGVSSIVSTDQGSVELHLVRDPAWTDIYKWIDGGQSSFTYTHSRTDTTDELRAGQVVCTTTYTEDGSASGAFSTYVEPPRTAVLHNSVVGDPFVPLGPDTKAIVVTMFIPFIDSIHTEAHGTVDFCDYSTDTTQHEAGPFDIFVAIQCLPEGTEVQLTDQFVGRWDNDRHAFEFDCQKTVTSGDTTGTLTVTGELTRS